MKTNLKVVCAALAVAFGMAVHAEDGMLLRAKVELVVGQADDLYKDSCRKGSESYGVGYQYFYGLIHATGKVLLDRPESQLTTIRMKKYLELIEKDYEAYTRIEAAASKAAATGHDRVLTSRHRIAFDGSRHRAKRITNAEKLRDKELGAAIQRWEKFALQLKREEKSVKKK